MKCPARLLGFVLSFLTLAALPARATWSIIVLDRKTGEVAIASATCLSGTDLASIVPILRVGRGAAATQASALNNQGKQLIKKAIKLKMTPHAILQLLLTLPSADERQYGIVTVSGPPVSWSGNHVCMGLHNITGTVGDIAYAIQGNLLTGKGPVKAAEEALLGTPGDLAERMMSAMQAARLMGGDARCSCELYSPGGICGGGATACGQPPADFDPNVDKSAHTGFLIVSRTGDINSGCSIADGCAAGDYYLNVEFNGEAEDPDPVVVMQMLYDNWRADLIGRPDGILSTVDPREAALPADGASTLAVDVALVDVEGTPLSAGGALFLADNLAKRPAHATYLFADDHGDGTYTLHFQATEKPGQDTYQVQIDDGKGRLVTLHPHLEITTL